MLAIALAVLLQGMFITETHSAPLLTSGSVTTYRGARWIPHSMRPRCRCRHCACRHVSLNTPQAPTADIDTHVPAGRMSTPLETKSDSSLRTPLMSVYSSLYISRPTALGVHSTQRFGLSTLTRWWDG
ncbi:MAG: hypothetical protein J07HQX50_01585 [Haloquadratum sp. J07HQX50]|nr:MAG: hypothetical protein J07HQX50_01585 [Haloquadratum sp. J07HQX50]